MCDPIVVKVRQIRLVVLANGFYNHFTQVIIDGSAIFPSAELLSYPDFPFLRL